MKKTEALQAVETVKEFVAAVYDGEEQLVMMEKLQDVKEAINRGK